MTFLTSPYIVQKIVVIINIFIMLISLFDLFFFIKRRAKPYYVTVLGMINFLVSSLITLFLISFIKSDNFENIPQISLWAINRSIWLYLFVEILLLSLSIVVFILGYKFDKNYISKSSIKEGFDYLPTGICFYEESGVLMLTNIKMNDLCLKILKHPLINGLDFWNSLRKKELIFPCLRLNDEEKPIIKIDNNIYSFKRIIHKIDGEIIYEIVATDITTKYNLSIDLEKKNKELILFNKRIRDYGDNINELIAKKETLNAKIYIHDELGRLLLLTKKALSKEMSKEEKSQLLNLWQRDLLSFKETKQNKNFDTYNGLYLAAKSIGVIVEINGIKPKEKKIKSVVINASIECITNTIKYTKGNIVKVNIIDEKNIYIITIKNNGNQPNSEIIERGGLSSLRSLVEREGGTMNIISLPEFELKIIMPKEKENDEWEI